MSKAGSKQNGVGIFVCDDETPVRLCLQMLLGRANGMHVVGESGVPDECIQKIQSLQPAIATLDICMRSKSEGLQLCREIVSRAPDTCIVAYSAYLDQPVIRTLGQLGVRALVDKGSDIDELVDAVNAVAEGRTYLCSTVSKKVAHWSVFKASGRGLPSSRPILSPQQQRVLEMVADGYTSSEISKKFGVAESTIRTQRRRIMERLKVHNTAQLLRLSGELGLI